MTRHSRPARGLPCLHAAVLLWPCLAAGQAVAADLVVTAPPGQLATALDTAFVRPFADAAKLSVSVVPPDPAVRGNAQLLDGKSVLEGCRTGALIKLDWGLLGGRGRLIGPASSDCGVGVMVRSLVLTWNRQKFPGSPTWGDFWDVAKIPGKRGLHRGARGNLEFALMADGVAAADVYGTLRSDGGVDRALHKLDQLKPYLVFWRGEDEPAHLLSTGEVLMTSAQADAVLAATPTQDYAVQWAGGLLSVESLAITAGGPAAPAALRLLAFAADPKQPRRLAAFPGLGSTIIGGDPPTPAEKTTSPSAPDNITGALAADEAFWHDNEARLDAQFEAWLAKP